jgi:hypothetical protein
MIFFSRGREATRSRLRGGTEQLQHAVDFGDHRIENPVILFRNRQAPLPQSLELLSERKRELHSSQIDTSFLYQVLDLPQPFEILG